MLADTTDGSPEYVFDRAEGEEENRLEEQSRVVDPITERLFREAGLTTGMRVLDLGSGAGDVSMLVARIVGSEGAVVGLEASPDALDAARRRIHDAGVHNASFVQGDLRELDAGLDLSGPPFDAVVGRFILQFMPDPARVLEGAARLVRPGGLICFQECDDWYTWAYPSTPLWDQVREWFLGALEGAGVEQRMGLRLYQTFLAAGLPAPDLRLEAAIGGGDAAPAFLWAGVVRAVMPTIERLGMASAAEVDVATLAERLLAETVASEGVVISLILIGAWARTTSAGTSV